MGGFLRTYGLLVYWACIAVLLTGAMQGIASDFCILALIVFTIPLGLIAIPGSFHGDEEALVVAVIVCALINSFIVGLIWLATKVRRSPSDQ